MNILVFDIETIPDTENGQKIYELDSNLSKKEIAEKMFERRREETNGSDFLRCHLHRIITISAVLQTPQGLKVWSLGESHSTEKELIERFFAGIDKYTPTLVSWNGSGFDLPVLHYRALLHGVTSPTYWETGEALQPFRWNNYLSRYHYRHMDLMDILAGYQARANAPLDEIAIMLGLPGKMGMHGSHVWEYYQEGKIEKIRDYCETDVLNTYLVFLRFELIRGKLSTDVYEKKLSSLKDYLKKENKSHFQTFLGLLDK